MEIDPRTAYRALTTRDARFDGRLYVGVTSTGVYCRPICRVRTPKRENCRFFATPAQAEAAAFRPCMKCRPEIAPGPGLAWSVMDASRTLARQAADALDAQTAGEDDGARSLAELAGRIGVSDRHLRRIFLAEHGVTPVQYVRTRRLLLAKQLLTDTTLPVAQVALQCGFRSLRRFNAAFTEHYRMSPSKLRGGSDDHAGAATDDGVASLVLGFREPYDRAALLRFVAQRAIPGVESVDAASIRRSVRAGVLGEAPAWIEAAFVDGAARLRVRFPLGASAQAARLVALVRRWLDLDAAPEPIAEALAELPPAPGLRLPGSVDAFELAVRAVLGQQVTVAAARTLARRFVERFGTPVVTPWPEITTAFPAPEPIARLDAGRIAELGIIRSRADAIVAIAREWPRLATIVVPRAPPEPLIEALVALPGIGAWTAHYVAMRALGWPDAFPPGDMAALKAMRGRFGSASPKAALARAEAWRPWRAYALLRLWNSLEGSSR
jgi:AraC family transcriptional regulator of adaptative response / DNA-3-methyladenine glycosylase II